MKTFNLINKVTQIMYILTAFFQAASRWQPKSSSASEFVSNTVKQLLFYRYMDVSYSDCIISHYLVYKYSICFIS